MVQPHSEPTQKKESNPGETLVPHCSSQTPATLAYNVAGSSSEPGRALEARDKLIRSGRSKGNSRPGILTLA